MVLGSGWGMRGERNFRWDGLEIGIGEGGVRVRGEGCNIRSLEDEWRDEVELELELELNWDGGMGGEVGSHNVRGGR